MKPRALIAMSGGVDSTVAALETLKAGYDCFGVTMKLCDIPDACGSGSDAADAKAVCDRLGMPHEVLDLQKEFENGVIRPFVAAYEAGQTPNPCILCNRSLKFGLLWEKARALGCEILVTGHYARTESAGGRVLLQKARCAAKDQSYVLYRLTQDELAHLRFPLGNYESKEQVRAVAAENGFSSAAKKDSQDICFVPDGDYYGFLRRYTGKDYPAGDFLDGDGHPVGRHAGLPRYTVGQRKGLGIALGEPMYVKEKNVAANTVTLVRNEALFASEMLVGDVNRIVPFGGEPFRAQVKPRYKAAAANATLTPLPDGTLRVAFDEPQRALTPVQSAVFYDQETVLGGGIIL